LDKSNLANFGDHFNCRCSLATVVVGLIEVPVMLMLVKICLKTHHWFKTEKYVDPIVARAEH